MDILVGIALIIIGIWIAIVQIKDLANAKPSYSTGIIRLLIVGIGLIIGGIILIVKYI
jgi:uncharacterized protein YneF (UPF0154 family)